MNRTNLVQVIATVVKHHCELPDNSLRADDFPERLMFLALEDCGVIRITDEHDERLFAQWVDEKQLHCIDCEGLTNERA